MVLLYITNLIHNYNLNDIHIYILPFLMFNLIILLHLLIPLVLVNNLDIFIYIFMMLLIIYYEDFYILLLINYYYHLNFLFYHEYLMSLHVIFLYFLKNHPIQYHLHFIIKFILYFITKFILYFILNFVNYLLEHLIYHHHLIITLQIFNYLMVLYLLPINLNHFNQNFDLKLFNYFKLQNHLIHHFVLN